VQPQDCSTTIAKREVVANRGLFRVRNWLHPWGQRTVLMGIINVTPDSFSGDGLMPTADALSLALEQLRQGAEIIDVGGESTRPGFEPISSEEEIDRVIPVIKALRSASPDAIISIDTTKAAVLNQAIEAGADILNSIWGLKEDLIPPVRDHKMPVVLMHNKEKPVYEAGGVVEEVLRYLSEHAEKAVRAGVKPENIILDPGIGFGKLAEHNLQVLNKLDRLVKLGFPTLLGTSRKSFIGKITGQSVENRVFGSAAAVSLAIASGIDIVRVHDVAAMKDVVQVADAIVRGCHSDEGNPNS
jgi:dihydropteroate synthase